jgi:hypothetical protein
MKITNDANTTIIGSNTTVVIPNSDSITSNVVVACNNGSSYRISKECYVALEELFKEQIGKIESNKLIIVKE